MGFDFSLTQEQEEIRRLAHEFAVNEMRPVAPEYDEKEETPWAVMQKAHDLGLDAASGFPEAYGGGGIDLMTSLIRPSNSPGATRASLSPSTPQAWPARPSSPWVPRSRRAGTSA